MCMQGCASPRQMLLSGVADALAAQGRADEDDLLLAQYILLCVANHTHPSANTQEDEQYLQDFINNMKQAALGNE